MKDKISEFAKNLGISDVGFCKTEDGPFPFAISLVVKLSDAIVDEIEDAPTYSYFQHYRTVNAFIDSCMLRIGNLLQENGYKYIPIPASQSIPDEYYAGRYSHKKAAVLSGLGFIGKNSMFLHKKMGARVRLGTIFTDCPFDVQNKVMEPLCGSCDTCVRACPSGAILGETWYEGIPRDKMFEARLCSEYMKKEFQHIGRGAVCGICMKSCKYNKFGG